MKTAPSKPFLPLALRSLGHRRGCTRLIGPSSEKIQTVKRPAAGGRAAGRFRNQRDQGGQVPDRLQTQQCRPVLVPHIVTKMPCRSEDRQGIASFHRRSPRKGRTLQAYIETAQLVVCSQRLPGMLADLDGRASVSSCYQRIWSVITPAPTRRPPHPLSFRSKCFHWRSSRP